MVLMSGLYSKTGVPYTFLASAHVMLTVGVPGLIDITIILFIVEEHKVASIEPFGICCIGVHEVKCSTIVLLLDILLVYSLA